MLSNLNAIVAHLSNGTMVILSCDQLQVIQTLPVVTNPRQLNSHCNPDPTLNVFPSVCGDYFSVPSSESLINIYSVSELKLKFQISVDPGADESVSAPRPILIQAELVTDWRRACDYTEGTSLAVAHLSIIPDATSRR